MKADPTIELQAQCMVLKQENEILQARVSQLEALLATEAQRLSDAKKVRRLVRMGYTQEHAWTLLKEVRNRMV